MTTPHGGSEGHSIGKEQPKEKIQKKEIYVKLDLCIEEIIKHSNSMHDAFKEYCKTAKEGGLTPNETWRYIYTKLKNRIPKSTLYEWGNAELPGGTKKTKPISKKIPDPESFGSRRLPELIDRTVSATELYKEKEKEVLINTKGNPAHEDSNATLAQSSSLAANNKETQLEENELLHFQISIPANNVWDFIIDYSPLLDREKMNHFCIDVVFNKRTEKVVSARMKTL
ncbi:MAG: hypothetical protein ACRD8W_05900 [Nitrososphaeraceae archaeon]